MARGLKYKDINLIIAQDRNAKIAKVEKTVAVRQPVLILILVLLLLGLGYYYLHTETNTLETDNKALTLFIEDPTTIADNNESLRMMEVATKMIAQKEELAAVLINLSSYPDMQGGDFHLIYEYAGKRIGISEVKYSRTTGVLSFSAESDTVTGVPIFVGQLRMSAIFDDIKYEGYSERVQTFTEELPPIAVPRLDEFGNHVTNPANDEYVYDLIPQTRTYTVRTYIFAVTALMRAPVPGLPGPGQSLYGGAEYEED